MRRSRPASKGTSSDLFLLAMGIFAWGALCSEVRGDDTQYWNEVIFEVGLSDRVDTEIAFEQKVVDNLTDFGLANVTLEPSYRINQWFSLGPGYRYERERDEGDWMTEHRYWLHATFKRELAGYKAKFKPKLEFRDLEGDDVWRIRTKLKIQRSLQLGYIEIAPFLFEDPFHCDLYHLLLA